MGQVKPIQRRIFEAIQATPSDKRGYVLNEAMRFAGDRVSFSDLLTDLGPFIESERAAERKAWARLVRAEDRMHGPPGAICVPSEKTEREYEAAKQALRDLGVDVDALLGEP